MNDLPPANTAPLTPEQFRILVAKIQPLFGAERALMPGTKLGPLRGKARGEAGDFAWVNPWTPLLRESVWRAAEAFGVPLIGIRAELNASRKSYEPLVELEASPKVRLQSSLVPEKCAICGRWPIKAPDKLVLEASSFDPSIPLQRVVELPTKLIVNERFAQFIQERKLRDIVLTPVEVQ